MDRRTETGLAMTSMLAKGQVIPLAMTLELLKGVAKLTASDNLVIQNLPMYVDQVEHLSQHFRIDRVFHVSGSASSMNAWLEEQVKGTTDNDEKTRKISAFEEQKRSLGPLVAHFSKLGMLQRIEATEKDELLARAQASTMPQYVVISGVSSAITGKQSQLLAASLGTRPLARAANMGPKELKAFADANGVSTLVLDRPAEAAQLVAAFGPPKLAVNIICEDEFLEEEYKRDHEDEEFDAEAFAARTAAEKAGVDVAMQVFGGVMRIERKLMKTAEEMQQVIKKGLLPRTVLILAPEGKAGLSSMMAEAVCMQTPEGQMPERYTVIDASKLCLRGGHGPAIEEGLRKAALNGRLPADLWAQLFSEAIARSANPLGSFLVINYPTAERPGFAIRDQLALLESVSNLQAVIRMKVSTTAFKEHCSGRREDLEAYQAFEAQAYSQALIQLGQKMFECAIDGDAASQVSSAALAFKAFLATV